MTNSQSWTDVYTRVQSTVLLGLKVRNGSIYPRWIEGTQSFWYDRRTDAGIEIRIVDAATGKNRLAFTQNAVAKKLASKLDADIDSELLILTGLKVAQDVAHFDAFGKYWSYHFDSDKLEEAVKSGDKNWLISPDKKSAALIRDDNLWIRDLASGKERALTTDGTETNAYASPPAATRYLRAMLGATPEGLWSPDSRHFLTLQTDDRHVPDLSLLNFVPAAGVRPIVSANRTSLPGDPKVTEFRMLSIDVETGRQTEARHSRLSAVRMNDTPFAAGLTWWSADGKTAYFVDIERGEKAAHVVAFDVATGATQVIFSERAETYVELSVNVYAPALVYPLPKTNELIWYSERSGHGHLYLYDLTSGKLKHPITQGPWQLRDVQHVDEVRREVFFTAAGIAADEDPYLCKPCIASLDGGETKVVSSAPGDHIVWRPGEFSLTAMGTMGGDRFAVSGLSPDGEYFVETIGAADRLPVTVLRRRNGEQVAVIEKPDEKDLPSDWQWPEPVKLKAADGKTDTYGLLFKPPGYDPKKSYPVIDLIYGGPQVSWVPKTAFLDGGLGTYFDAASLAALGSFVMLLDGRGTANRERAFREASHGAVHTASNLEDHIAGLRQLAQKYPSMDLERVGITGHSGGGYMTALAALRFGDFFKVAVASSGNYDQAMFWHSWGERYHGLFEEEHYKAQAPKTYAAGLTGKILFAHGLMDSGCHPGALFQLIQAMIEQNKDMDLIVFPRGGHPTTGYYARRRLDYFVQHLFGSTPPPAMPFKIPYDGFDAKRSYNAAPPVKNSSGLMTGELAVEQPLFAGEPDAEIAAPWSAWFALAVLVIAVLFGFVDRQVISLLAEPIRHALNLSDSRLGIIQGLGFAVFTIALSFPIGWLTDRFDRRVVLGGCVLVWATATAACGLAHNFLQLFLATIGIAAGEAGLSPIIYSILPDLFSYRQRVTANLIFYISSILGIALGFGLGGAAIGALTALHPHLPPWLQEWESWRLAFFAVSLPGPLLVVLIAFQHLPRRHGAKTMATPAGFSDFFEYVRENFISISTAIGSMGVYSFAYGATLTWLPVVLVRVFKMTPAFSGGALGGVIGIGTLAGVAIAAVAMRFVVPRLGKAAPVRIGRMAMLAGAVPAALIFFASTWWQLLALALLQTIAGVTAGSLTPNMIQDLSPARFRARMAAVMAMITGPISGSSVIVVGIVSDAFFHHEQRGLILAIATVALPGWLVAYTLMQLAERPFMRTVQAISASGDE